MARLTLGPVIYDSPDVYRSFTVRRWRDEVVHGKVAVEAVLGMSDDAQDADTCTVVYLDTGGPDMVPSHRQPGGETRHLRDEMRLLSLVQAVLNPIAGAES